MVDVFVSSPASIEEAAFKTDERGLMTVAALLLCAGVWHLKLDEKREPDQKIIPINDLNPLGVPSDWQLVDGSAQKIDFPSASFSDGKVDFSDAAIAQALLHAIKTRRTADLSHAVALGMESQDSLIRICALTSAFEMFLFPPGEFLRRLFTFEFRAERTASIIHGMLVSRALNIALSAVGPPPPAAGLTNAQSPDLILIHGTNFPPHRPVWSVPVTGPLFQHISSLRADLYCAADYPRWEGGYSDYAREVAALNIDDWIQRRGLNGVDVVSHSHGGNVLMGASTHSTTFGRVVFLSCPVRWNQYQLHAARRKKVDSVRVRFDKVILADRASQTFPIGSGITDTFLPIWFDHGATTDPANWKKHNIDRFVN
jgi:hypothetical protein